LLDTLDPSFCSNMASFKSLELKRANDRVTETEPSSAGHWRRGSIGRDGKPSIPDGLLHSDRFLCVLDGLVASPSTERLAPIHPTHE